MRNLKQIREQKELIIEREEAEDRKLSSLVRAGLFDSKKLPALKRALDKSADKISGQEKRMLINLLDSLMDQVLSNQTVYQKVKQNVMKEEYLDESKLDRTTRDINDLPNIIMLRRRAIRTFPGGGKVVMYWADKINRYIPIPVDPINTITRGPHLDSGLMEATSFSNMSSDEQDKLVKSTRKMNPVAPSKKKKLLVRTKLGKETQAKRLERVKAGRQYQAAIKPGGEQGYVSQAYQFAKGGNKAAALGTLAGGAIGSLARKMVKEGVETTRIKMKKVSVSPLTGVRKNALVREEFSSKLSNIREEQLDEGLVDTAIMGAGRLALKYGPKAIGAAGRLAGKYGGKLLSKGKSLLGKGARLAKRAIGKLGKSADKVATGAVAADALSGGSSKVGSNTKDSGYQTQRREVSRTAGESSFKNARVGDYATRQARDNQLQRKAFQQTNESIIKNLKTIKEGDETFISFNDGSNINVNYTLAKKIINIYESMNKNNKQKMANMLQESVDNFKKISNFAIENGK